MACGRKEPNEEGLGFPRDQQAGQRVRKGRAPLAWVKEISGDAVTSVLSFWPCTNRIPLLDLHKRTDGGAVYERA